MTHLDLFIYLDSYFFISKANLMIPPPSFDYLLLLHDYYYYNYKFGHLPIPTTAPVCPLPPT